MYQVHNEGYLLELPRMEIKKKNYSDQLLTIIEER